MKKGIVIILVVTFAYVLGVYSGREGYIPLEECVPLEDIACWYIDGYDYPSFSLKDITHQLDDFNNANYIEDICTKVEDANEEYAEFWKKNKECPLEMQTPMGHEMEFVQHINEFLYEYRDTYTGTHYIVSVIDETGTIYRPLYKEKYEPVVTN